MDPKQRELAPSFRIVYRSMWRNVLIVAAILLIAVSLAARGWYATDARAVRITWWTAPWIFVALGVVMVRGVRRGVVVTDTRLVQRTLLLTNVYPWTELERSCTTRTRLGTQVFKWNGGGRVASIAVHDRFRRVPFRSSVDRALSSVRAGQTQRGPDSPPSSPSADRSVLQSALWISLCLVVVGSITLENGLWDSAYYEARAARDRTTVATVASSRIIEHDDGESGTSYSTRVHIVFQAGERHVATAIERPNVHHFEREHELPIVYDAAHPRDADFRDRHNRRANASSARLHTGIGAIMTMIGGLAGVVLGLTVCRTLLNKRGNPAVRGLQNEIVPA
jgi:hypothetical protein